MILSIIIPCYNSANFLRRSLEKLLTQNLDNCEIILINDGSTDGTLSIIQDYINCYSNIVLINQTNQGVSVARNNGINKAKGKYLYFLDSDDELSADSIEYIKTQIISNPDCNILGFGYKAKKNESKVIDYCCPDLNLKHMTGEKALNLFLVGRLRLNICSLAISRDFVNKNRIYFEVGHAIGEDILFICRLLFSAQSIIYHSRHCFTYLIRNDSVTGGGKFSEKNLETLEFLRLFLLPKEMVVPWLEKPINYFLMLRWGRAFLSYMQSSTKDENINRKLIQMGSIRFRPNYVGNIKMWLAMKFAALLPLKSILRIFK